MNIDDQLARKLNDRCYRLGPGQRRTRKELEADYTAMYGRMILVASTMLANECTEAEVSDQTAGIVDRVIVEFGYELI